LRKLLSQGAWNLRGCQDGGQGRDRTADTRIFSPLLYQLSYLAIKTFSVYQKRPRLALLCLLQGFQVRTGLAFHFRVQAIAVRVHGYDRHEVVYPQMPHRFRNAELEQ
jgi:hypothetical protein